MRWALFGASDIAATRMIPAIRASGDEISVLASEAGDHARQFAHRFGIPRVCAQPEEALQDDTLDAVYISSRNDRHVGQALLAVAAGKHVLCEKPVALTLASAQLLVDAVAAAGVVCAVNHHLPGAATHTKMRRLFAEGAIGEPLAVSVAHAVWLPERLQGWRLGDEPGSGVVADITCHDASVLNALLGVPATFATAVGVRQGPWEAGSDDAVMTAIRYGTVVVQTHDAFTVEHRPTSLEVFGTEGALLGSGVMTQDPSGTVVLRTAADGDRLVDVGGRRDLYATVLDSFRAAVHGDGLPTVTLEEGVNAFLVADAVAGSLSSGRGVALDSWFPVPAAASQWDHRG